jgi:hypothetical protein
MAGTRSVSHVTVIVTGTQSLVRPGHSLSRDRDTVCKAVQAIAVQPTLPHSDGLHRKALHRLTGLTLYSLQAVGLTLYSPQAYRPYAVQPTGCRPYAVQPTGLQALRCTAYRCGPYAVQPTGLKVLHRTAYRL